MFLDKKVADTGPVSLFFDNTRDSKFFNSERQTQRKTGIYQNSLKFPRLVGIGPDSMLSAAANVSVDSVS